MTPKSYGSQSGTQQFYVVEVRSLLDRSFELNGFIVTPQWQQYPARVVRCDAPSMHSGRIGEIAVVNLNPIADHNHLADFEAAYALACLLQTQAHALLNGSSIRARLVQIKLRYSWDTEQAGVSEEISLFELKRKMKFECEPTKADVEGA